MNNTITNINDNTMNLNIREVTKKLIANSKNLFRAVFTKKDGTERTMTFSIRSNWNDMNCKDSTASGRKMVATKCANGMATVTEFLADGSFVPRTLNLNTLKSLVVLPRI